MPQIASPAANKPETRNITVLTFFYLDLAVLILLYNSHIGCGKIRLGDDSVNHMDPMTVFRAIPRQGEGQTCAERSSAHIHPIIWKWISGRMVAVLVVDAGFLPGLHGQKRGKSELQRAVCRITSGKVVSRPLDGKCHREYTAANK